MCHRDHALISLVERVVVISIHRTVSCIGYNVKEIGAVFPF